MGMRPGDTAHWKGPAAPPKGPAEMYDEYTAQYGEPEIVQRGPRRFYQWQGPDGAIRLPVEAMPSAETGVGPKDPRHEVPGYQKRSSLADFI